MWSQEEEVELVENTEDFHLDGSELLGQLELYCETAPKIVCFPQFFLNFILFFCWDTLCKGFVFFSFPGSKSHKISERKLAGTQVLANPVFKVSLFLSKISI